MKKTYYIFSNGQIKRKDNTIQFIDEKSSKKDIPIETISDLYLMGEISLNTKFLNFIAQHEISAHFFNYYSFYTGSFYPRDYLQAGRMLVKQVEHYSDLTKRQAIAFQFLKAAADNIYRNLRYYSSRGHAIDGPMQEIDYLRRQLNCHLPINTLMGIEGNIRKTYYESWNVIVNQEINFNLRVKRPPDNMINTLISFINSLIYTRTLSEIYHTQLDPTISYLHEPGVRRFSLALDIAEIFKPIIGDRLIFSLLNRKQITEDDFDQELNFLSLNKKAAMLICQEFDSALQRTVKHKELGRSVSYQYLIRLEVYKLAKHLMGEKEYSGFVFWW